MGSGSSSMVGYRELRSSLPGSLVHEEDFQLFYSLCKVETARTMSSALYPSPSQLFFVVVSGDVLVQLSSKDVKPTTATVFSAGETIHFFNATLRGGSTLFSLEYSDAGECLRNGDIKLALQFRNIDKVVAKVIGIDRRGLDEFMVRARSNTHAIASFLNMNMVELFSVSPFCRTLTVEQANMFGPLLKIRLAHTGREVGPHIRPAPMRSTDKAAKKAKEGATAGTDTAEGGECNLTMVLHGSILSVPVKSNMQQVLSQIHHREGGRPPSAGAGPSPSHLLMPTFGKFRAPPAAPASPLYAPLVYHITELEKAPGSGSQERNDSGRGKSHLVVGPGGLVGTDQFLIRNPKIRIRTTLTTQPSVLGYISFDTMDVLYSVDPRFKRVYERNYFMTLIAWVKFSVPFLLDMDEWSLALLSCKLTLIGVNTGDPIKRRGQNSDFAYILLGGAAKIASANADPDDPAGQLQLSQQESELKWGALLGVVALTTNTPYFNTVVATEPTLLLRLSKRVLDQIYYNNKAKLCEIRIRLMGTDVDLLHAIDHPVGGELFLRYLANERASENLHFYRAVDRYDVMCKDVRKHYAQIQKLRQKFIEEEAQAAALAAQAGTERNLPSLQLTAESGVSTPAPLTPDPTTPGRVTSDDSSANSVKHSPLPKRLAPIYSASNLEQSNKSHEGVNKSTAHIADGAAVGAVAPGPLRIGDDDDQPPNIMVKTKPAPRTQPCPRQSSFSGRVALALAGDSNEYDPTEPELSEMGGGSSFIASPTAPCGVAAASMAVAGSFVAQDSPANDSPERGAGAAAPSVASSQSEEQMRYHQQQALASHQDTPAAAEGGVAAQGIGALEPGAVARKQRRHKSSFISAKTEVSDRAHEHFERTQTLFTLKGNSAPASVKADDDGLVDDDDGEIADSLAGAPVSSAVHRQRLAKKIDGLYLQLRTHVLELNEAARVIMQTFIYNDSEQQLNLPDTMRIRCERTFSDWVADLARAPRTDLSLSTAVSRNLLEGNSAAQSPNAKGPPTTQVPFTSSSGSGHSSSGQAARHGGSTPSVHFRNAYGGGNPSAGVATQSPPAVERDSSDDTAHTERSPYVADLAQQLHVQATQRDSTSRQFDKETDSDCTVAEAAAGSGLGIAMPRRHSGGTLLSPRTAAAFSEMDLSFIDLFKEIKLEILKLLSDDKFPRWKATPGFQQFIASIRPYDAAKDPGPGGGGGRDGSVSIHEKVRARADSGVN